MTTGTLHPLAHDSLERLRAASGRMPREARRDLLADIEAHTTRDKWIGTLVLPGGLVASVLALALAGVSSSGGSGTCVVAPGGEPVCSHGGGPGTGASIAPGVALILVPAAPIATSVHLARRARRSVAAA